MSETKGNFRRIFLLGLAYCVGVLASFWLLAAVMMRLLYAFKTPEPIPALDDDVGMWEYYKTWWNSWSGATMQARFDEAWERVVP